MTATRVVGDEVGDQTPVGRTNRDLPVKLSWQLLMALKREASEPMLNAMTRQAGIGTLSELTTRMEAGKGIRSAEYAQLLATVRGYYGHGARGMLVRVGITAWEELVRTSGLGIKTKGVLGRRLFKKRIAYQVLDLLAEAMGEDETLVSVHLLDTEFYLVDSVSDATFGQTAEEPICAVTLGLIQGALIWGTGGHYDVEEEFCMAAGADRCRFRIRP